jgi:hypothetical protein
VPELSPQQRALRARIGGLKSWSQTVNRTARTEPARAAGPGNLGYWLGKLNAERFANATQQQRLDAADCLRRAHFAGLAFKSAKARKKAQ